MPDTYYYPTPKPKVPCSDCGKIGGVVMMHDGPMVPRGEMGYFCGPCGRTRQDDLDEGLSPRSLGTPGRKRVVCDGCGGANRLLISPCEHECSGDDAVVDGQLTGQPCDCRHCRERRLEAEAKGTATEEVPCFFDQ